ncbi:MAG: TonB-dependent receptor plug domain-containing protein [Salinivirgaceae bacterium]|nr:TonB-dependent receptor plug domain-containing protein [Salinivirgaceae bacterium]
MKREFLFVTIASMTAVGAVAQEAAQSDTVIAAEQLQEVVINGVRAQQNAPFAVSNIKKTELNEFSKTGRELPFLFSQTPGVIAWSENGLGTGTTYMRIRGAGDSRINVTLDGVPLNSPEDQCVFWANMNSYGSLLGSVQIQRGVGSSTNGDGAFGGTVALSSALPMQTAGVELSVSYGSFNTVNFGGKASTGLLFNSLIIDGAYHQTRTDGYIHGTSANSGSYYGGITWQTDNLQVRYKNIGNFERTGQAWNGVTAGNDDLSIMDGIYGERTGIKTYEDMWDAGLGKFNSLYEALTITPLEQKTVGKPYEYTTQRYQMADGSFWDRTTDNFWQDHNILSAAWQINSNLATTASLHYTYGYGYYEEFRPNNKLKKYGLSAKDAEGNSIKKTDFVRKKGLSQNTYGVVWNINYTNDLLDIIGGASVQNFEGNHFGYLNYIKDKTVADKYLADGDYKYYDSDASKFDGSAFAKAALHLTEGFDVFADVQFRHVGYATDGINDKFYDDKSGLYNQPLNIDEKYNFLNPKAGFSWRTDAHRVYGSVALSHREPERNNFTDNGSYPAPKAEQMFDYELGYQFAGEAVRAGANFYFMDYTDQFVQTGAQSDIGEKLTTNIKDSYRAGAELQAAVDITEWLTIEGNAALSINKIKNFDEMAEDWDDVYDNYLDENGVLDEAMVQYAIENYHIDGNLDGFRSFHYDNSTLAFSPSAIVNGFVNFHLKGWQAVWHTNYVSRQYLDNTENKDRSLPAYTTSNLNLSYTLKPKRVLKEAVFGLNFSNLFNHHYAASGWVYSAVYESGGHPNDNRYYQIGFIPMAGFTAMGSVTVRF